MLPPSTADNLANDPSGLEPVYNIKLDPPIHYWESLLQGELTGESTPTKIFSIRFFNISLGT
jgi:hypothetical protein